MKERDASTEAEAMGTVGPVKSIWATQEKNIIIVEAWYLFQAGKKIWIMPFWDTLQNFITVP